MSILTKQKKISEIEEKTNVGFSVMDPGGPGVPFRHRGRL